MSVEKDIAEFERRLAEEQSENVRRHAYRFANKSVRTANYYLKSVERGRKYAVPYGLPQ